MVVVRFFVRPKNKLWGHLSLPNLFKTRAVAHLTLCNHFSRPGVYKDKGLRTPAFNQW